MVRLRHIFLVLSALVLSACSQGWDARPPKAPAGGVGITANGTLAAGSYAVASVTELPTRSESGVEPPFGSSSQAAAYEYGQGYKVGAGDRLTVRVVGEPDLTNDYLVDGSGNISMPFIQSAAVAGLTAPEIADLISERLRQGYLREPSVSVQVTALRPFFILGEVNTAGSFAYQEGMTVQNAVAIAGGYGARAHQGAVLITRRTAKGTATYKVPVTTQVYPGDVIYVRERWF